MPCLREVAIESSLFLTLLWSRKKHPLCLELCLFSQWRSQRELFILEPWVAFLFLDNRLVKIYTLSFFLWLYQSICQAQNNSQSTVIHCTPARMATGLIKNFTEYTSKQTFELNQPMIGLVSSPLFIQSCWTVRKRPWSSRTLFDQVIAWPASEKYFESGVDQHQGLDTEQHFTTHLLQHMSLLVVMRLLKKKAPERKTKEN